MLKILIVDDDYISREGLRDYFDWNAYGAVISGEAKDGLDALQKIKQDMPDIVITDVVMPRCDGMELLKRIGQAYPHIKVLMISAHHELEYIRTSIKLDALDYLLKPFNQTELENAVKKVIHRVNMEKEQSRKLNEINSFFVQSLNTDKDTLTHQLNQIRELFGTGQSEALERKLEGLFRLFQENNINSILFLINTLSDLVLSLRKNAEGSQDISFRLPAEGMGDFKAFSDVQAFFTERILSLDEKVSRSKNSGTRKLIRQAARLVDEKYATDLTIRSLAQELHISSSHLQALFKQEMKTTINDYLTAVRMEKAKVFLKDSTIKIYEVAQKVGYTDTSYFTRIFKKVVGLSPIEYREKVK